MRGRLRASLLLVIVVAAFVPPAEANDELTITLQAPRYVAAGSAAQLDAFVSLRGAPQPAAVVEFVEDGGSSGRIAVGCCDGSARIRLEHAERGVHTVQAWVGRGTPVASASPPVTISWAVPPGAPGLPTASFRTWAEVLDLRWSAPNDDGGAPTTSFRVYRAPAEHGPWTLEGNSSARELSVFLPFREVRWFRVHAVNVAGEGAPGPALEVVGAEPVPPGPPRALELAVLPGPKVAATWAAPLEMGNGIGLAYRVEVSRDGGPFSALPATTTRSAQFNAVWNSTYEVRVRASTSAGPGSYASGSIGTGSRTELTLAVDRIWLCQEPGCDFTLPGGTIPSFTHGEATIEVDLSGELWRGGAVVGGEVALEASLLVPVSCWPPDVCVPSEEVPWNGTATTGAGGAWSATPTYEVPASPGDCIDYFVLVTARAGSEEATEEAMFTVCWL